jgi:hypothetical protein
LWTLAFKSITLTNRTQHTTQGEHRADVEMAALARNLHARQNASDADAASAPDAVAWASALQQQHNMTSSTATGAFEEAALDVVNATLGAVAQAAA